MDLAEEVCSISALQPFQQVLIFLLFLCGDMSIVSLVMVLVRKHYFRIHCSQLLKNDYLRRTNTIMPDHQTQSFFSRTFTINPASPISAGLKGMHSRHGPGYDVHQMRNGTKMEISGPSNARELGSFIPDVAEKKDGVENTGPSLDHGRLGEIRAMAESPLSFHRSRVSFRPSNETQRHPPQIDDSMEGPTVQGSVDEEELVEGEVFNTNGPANPRTLHVHDDKLCPTRQYQARQRIRSQSRAMSLGVGPSPKTVLYPLDQTKTMPVHTPTPLPRPEGIRHSGMGGFPTVSQLLPHLLPHRTRSSIHRHFSRPNLERQTTMLTNVHTQQVEDGERWSENLMSSMARWMPDTLTLLVVGRNSRFFTEELDDDELEQIGGVEYRALRFLSYFVAAVS